MSEAVAETAPIQRATFVTAMYEDTKTLLSETLEMFGNMKGDVFKINTQADYDYVVDLLKDVKAVMKTATDRRSELTQPLEATKKAIIAEFKEYQDQLSEIETKGKNAMVDFQERERKRVELEQAEADEKARREREKLAERSDKAAAKGKFEKAEELEAQSMAVQSQTVESNVPKAKGVSTRATYEAEVVDKFAFVNAALANHMLMGLIEIDMKKLNKMVKAMEGELEAPGIKIISGSSVSIRT